MLHLNVGKCVPPSPPPSSSQTTFPTTHWGKKFLQILQNMKSTSSAFAVKRFFLHLVAEFVCVLLAVLVELTPLQYFDWFQTKPNTIILFEFKLTPVSLKWT